MPQKKPAWNKDRHVGKRWPLTLKQTMEIADILSRAEKWRDWCLFVVATETMLRSVDLLRLRVLDVADQTGRVFDCFSVRQQKTRDPVTVSLSPYAQAVCRHWISIAQKRAGDYLGSARDTCKFLSL
jgi:integrase